MSAAGEFPVGGTTPRFWTDRELEELRALAEKPCKMHLLYYLQGKLGDGRQYVRELLEQLEAEGGYCKECYDVIRRQQTVIYNMGAEIRRLEKEAAQPALAPAGELQQLKDLNVRLRAELQRAQSNGAEPKAADASSVYLALEDLAVKTERVEELEELVLRLKSQCRLLRQQLEIQASYAAVQAYEPQTGAVEKLASRASTLRKVRLQAQQLKGHVFALRGSIYAARICALDYLGRLYTDCPGFDELRALLRAAK